MSREHDRLKTVGNILVGATGVRPLVAGLGGVVWAGTAVRRLGGFAARTFRPSKRTWPEFPVDEVTPAGRYEWLRERQGLSEDTLARMERSAANRVTLWSWAAILFVAYAIVAPSLGLLGHGLVPVLDYALPWVIATPVVLQAVRWSYWSLQLRRRALIPISTWVRSPGDWIPAESGGRFLAFAFGTLSVSVLLHPALALAQGVPGLQPAAGTNLSTVLSTMTSGLPQSDLSLQWMQRLFPSAFSASGVTYQQDAVAQILCTINSLLTGCAALMLSFHTLVGIANTAHTGQVLGDGKWHQIWAPIRVCIGFGALAPISGYCVAQLFVIQVFLAGFSLANVEWTLYVNATSGISAPVAITIPPDATDQISTLNALMASETCYWASTLDYRGLNNGQPADAALMNRMAQRTGYTGGRPAYAYPDAGGDSGNAAQTVWDYGTVCGSVAWPIHQPTKPTVLGGIANGFNWTVTPSASDAAKTAFDTSRATAYGTFVSAVRSAGAAKAAATMAAPSPAQAGQDVSALMAQVQTAFGAFKSAILTASGTLSTSLNTTSRKEFADNAKALGWSVAGALQPQLVRANATVVQRVAENPTISLPNLALVSQSNRTIATAAMSALTQIARQQPVAVVDVAGFETNELKEGTDDPVHVLDIFARHLTHRINAAVLSAASLNVTDPIGSIQDLGQTILLGVEAAWITPWSMLSAAGGTIRGAAQGSSSIPFVGWITGPIGEGVGDALVTVLTTLAGLWGTISFWLLACGAAMTVVLPMMQYVMWMFGLVGLMVYAVEAVCGAAFWAFSHVRMDGAELIDGPQRHGYALVFNALFRPGLMILGLIMGNIVFSICAGYVNATFVLASDMAMGARIIDPISMLVMLGLLVYLHYSLAVRSYSLITKLPDRVARWSGASGEGLDEEHGSNEINAAVTGGIHRQAGSAQALGGRGGGGENTLQGTLDRIADHLGAPKGGGESKAGPSSGGGGSSGGNSNGVSEAKETDAGKQ